MIINYLSEYPLPHAVDASHTTPDTHVNRGPRLLKSIDGDIVHALGGSRTYPGPQPRRLALNQTVLPDTTVT